MEETNNSMELTVGAVLGGKVKSITNFGAFVALPDNKTGMVHISEIANAYVSDIRQHLTEGQDVKVMVINLDGGKVNLSIKRLEPKPQQTGRPSFRREGGEGRPERPDRGNFRRENSNQQRPAPVRAAAPVPPSRTQDQGSAVRGYDDGIHVRVRFQALRYAG